MTPVLVALVWNLVLETVSPLTCACASWKVTQQQQQRGKVKTDHKVQHYMYFSEYCTCVCTHHISMCVSRMCLDGQNCLCPKVAEFNLSNLTKPHNVIQYNTIWCYAILCNAILSYFVYYLCPNKSLEKKILTWASLLSFNGMMLTHFPAFPRFGRSWWTPDPVGISLVSTVSSPLSAFPPDIMIQSFLIPGLYTPLKQSVNFFALKATCVAGERHNQYTLMLFLCTVMSTVLPYQHV